MYIRYSPTDRISDPTATRHRALSLQAAAYSACVAGGRR